MDPGGHRTFPGAVKEDLWKRAGHTKKERERARERCESKVTQLGGLWEQLLETFRLKYKLLYVLKEGDAHSSVTNKQLSFQSIQRMSV